jgi:hypothetical protein
VPPSIKAKYLLLEVTDVGDDGFVDMAGMFATQSVQTIAEPGDAAFDVEVEASMDNKNWFPFGDLRGTGIRTEAQHAMQFLRAKVVAIDPGAVLTVIVSWT